MIISDVAPGGPGDRAGLKSGDVVLTLDGRPMENARQFEVNVYRGRVGDIVTLEVQRGSETVKTTAAIAERPDDPARFAELVDAKQNLIGRLGILAVGVDPTVAARLPQMRAPSGVLIAGVLADAPAGSGPAGRRHRDRAERRARHVARGSARQESTRFRPAPPACCSVQRGDILLYVALELE